MQDEKRDTPYYHITRGLMSNRKGVTPASLEKKVLNDGYSRKKIKALSGIFDVFINTRCI